MVYPLDFGNGSACDTAFKNKGQANKIGHEGSGQGIKQN